MTISNLPPSSASTPYAPSVDDFRQSAALGEAVQVQLEGQSFKVIATGQTPSARSVAWVSGEDTTRMFVAALESDVGPVLSDAIASELGLHPAPGKPLSSRTVEQALMMADTANTALEGVRYATDLTAPLPPSNKA